jgi:hypothetical protein
VFHFLKKAVDNASSDQRGKISVIYLLLFATDGVAWAWAVISYLISRWQKLDQPLVAPAAEAP